MTQLEKVVAAAQRQQGYGKVFVLGDYASSYLAVLYGADPTPIEVLDRIKEALAAADLDQPAESSGSS